MAQTNPALGWELHKHLVKVGLETPMFKDRVLVDDAIKKSKIEDLVGQMMDVLGLDRSDDSLEETPIRVAKMYVNETMGGLNYNNFPKCTAVENKFHQHVEEGDVKPFVMLKNLRVNSLCEHHLLTILGHCHISMIPTDKVLGLSKFQRIVDFFSARPQVQERLCEQVAEAVKFITGSPHVAVYMDAKHTCMTTRGVSSPCADTVTLATRGAFASKESAVRSEFLAIARNG